MEVEVCKWLDNADSPAIFMVDDLANVWVDANGNGKVDPGEDWGYNMANGNSSFRFLESVLLKDYPWVKVTFFTPVGIRTGVLAQSRIASISKMIDDNELIRDFFRSISDNPMFEIAYHGTTHGRAGASACDYVQEWETFQSLEEAIDIVNKGREVYRNVFGRYPPGGKYCGYISNEFSDESINSTGFLWWCRYSNRALFEENDLRTGGKDTNPHTAFDIRTFGSNGVVDIPTTIMGSLLTGTLSNEVNSLKGIIRKVLRKLLVNRRLEQLDFLIKHKLVISIQEHIAPARDDGKRQEPNIFDDLNSLRAIFSYLKNKKVWYCTGTELAEYYLRRSSVTIRDCTGEGFYLENSGERAGAAGDITLKCAGLKGRRLLAPNGSEYLVKRDTFTIPALPGNYRVV